MENKYNPVAFADTTSNLIAFLNPFRPSLNLEAHRTSHVWKGVVIFLLCTVSTLSYRKKILRFHIFKVTFRNIALLFISVKMLLWLSPNVLHAGRCFRTDAWMEFSSSASLLLKGWKQAEAVWWSSRCAAACEDIYSIWLSSCRHV